MFFWHKKIYFADYCIANFLAESFLSKSHWTANLDYNIECVNTPLSVRSRFPEPDVSEKNQLFVKNVATQDPIKMCDDIWSMGSLFYLTFQPIL